METLDAIFMRRSIRRFKAGPVGDDLLQTFLRPGLQAPSANNLQPWRFIIPTKRDLLDAVLSFHRYSAMLREASLAVLVCVGRKAQPTEGYWVQGCSAAMWNILLAARAPGLGAVWPGIYPLKERMQGTTGLL